MKTNNKDMVKLLRELSKATAEYADALEKEDCTNEDFEKAAKNFMWVMMKLSNIE